MCIIAIEPLRPLDRTSRIKLYKNNARSRLFCRIAERFIVMFGSKLCPKFNFIAVFPIFAHFAAILGHTKKSPDLSKDDDYF